MRTSRSSISTLLTKARTTSRRKGLDKGINLIRYADDFVVTAPSREVLETYVRPRLEGFLHERGLAMSEAKTRIVEIHEGFNFLGFQLRRYGETTLAVPQKEKVLEHLRALKAYLEAHRQAPAGQVIRDLNPVIRGWANYYRHSSAKRAFGTAGHRQWQLLWRWAKRRHPRKSSRWVKARYFRDDGHWTFHAGEARLVNPATIAVTRFIKVKGKSSPYDPSLRRYWRERAGAQVIDESFSRPRAVLHRRQEMRCALCGIRFIPGEAIQIDHIISRYRGGTESLENKRLVHPWCHRQHHQRAGYGRPKA